MEGDLEKVQNMLRFVDPNSMKIGTNNEKTFALHEAAKRGHVKIMMVLIAAGADVDLQYQLSNGDLWDTALHIAAWNGHLSAVKILVASGASLTITKYRHGVALETAGQVTLWRVHMNEENQNFWKIFKFLVRNGAPLDFEISGKTARALSEQHGWVIPEQY